MMIGKLMQYPPFFASGGVIGKPKKLTQVERERLIYMCFTQLRKCGVEVEHIDVDQDPTIMKMVLKLSCFPAFPHTLVYEHTPPINKFDGKIDIDWQAAADSLQKTIDDDCN